MPENSKYNFFMNELTSLEKQVYSLVQKSEELLEEKAALTNRINKLELENEVLRLKIEELETIAPGRDVGNISKEDRDTLKKRIEEIVSKIDNHIGS